MSDSPGVAIGQAAALYGLAPSTLRWWEAKRVLPEPPRVNGRRVYTDTELRCIGLAYLCCITGAMPLERASVVTRGNRNMHWHNIVNGHAAVLKEKMAQLQSAHDYLMHLLGCPDDDIVGQCPDLDEELINHTPRGRAADQDLVSAARSLSASGLNPSNDRDEMATRRDENRPSVSRCAVCAAPFTQPARGRRRTYCSRACQQKNYRQNEDQR
ncbi:MerR family DNA-binding transcriptional regulator [Mycobacterium sp. RTGN4]|uniref:MerR family DNA-binding transcriptional regulator n=1 Tax=unclassified Mycobacterium TaxID=2642494 RepID=UPI0039AF5DC3